MTARIPHLQQAAAAAVAAQQAEARRFEEVGQTCSCLCPGDCFLELALIWALQLSSDHIFSA